MIDPAVSVVMPTYNTEETVADAIRSVLRQTMPDLELLVVDDGSDDRTRQVVEEIDDPRVRLLVRDHGGAAAARNAGIREAKGRVISFVDSDDFWLPRYVELMVAALDARPDAGFAYTDAYVLDAATGRIARSTAMQWQRPPTDVPADPDTFLGLLLRRNFVYASVSLPRSVVEAVGGFDETLQAGIDYELWLRIAAHGHPGVRAPGLLGVYRRGRSGSISENRVRVLSNLARIYRTAAETYPISAENRRLARSRLAETEAELEALQGRRSPTAAWRRMRPRLARVRHAVLRTDPWHDEPPSELLAAIPELGSPPD
jgi:glycosyltransferase involved in cell wall biosynthesis